MPGLAHLVAAADVGDDVDHAAVQQDQAVAVEPGRHAGAVGAVGIEEERRLAVFFQALAVDDRQRHLDAVTGHDPLAFGHVLRGVVAGNLSLLAEHPLAFGHVVIVDARRRDQALVAEAEGARGVFRSGDGGSSVDALRKADVVPLAVSEVENAEVVEGCGFLGSDEVVLEQLDVSEAARHPGGAAALSSSAAWAPTPVP